MQILPPFTQKCLCSLQNMKTWETSAFSVDAKVKAKG